MDPFGNFGWDFGFGFGWIMVAVVALLLIIAVAQLSRFSFSDKSDEERAFTTMKQEMCSNKMSFDELEDRVKNRVP